MSVANTDLDVFKDIPGYKGILKAVLKYQIQQLVEQLSQHVGEESVLLSANVSEGTLSHLGTEVGKQFLIDSNEVKRQYLSYCLKVHQKEKRKSECMSSVRNQENVQPVKIVRVAPESVVNFPVHKKPYFRANRRNTRIRSGSKQFASTFSKAGVNRPGGQKLVGGKVVPSASYLDPKKNESGTAYKEHVSGSEDQTSDEAFNLYHEGQRSDGQGEGDCSQVIIKSESQTDASAVSKENDDNFIEGEKAVTVKVEPVDDMDETRDKESRAVHEDIQAFGDGLGQHYSPNASRESEESFYEGNQSFEYLLDQDNSSDIITPWKPEEHDKVAQIPSKRKQTLPTRITKSGDGPGTFSHAVQIHGGISANQRAAKSDWISGSEVKGSMKHKHSHIPSYRENNADGILSQQSYLNVSDYNSQRNTTFGGKHAAENMYGKIQSSALSHDHIHNLSVENMPNSGLHSDKVMEKSVFTKGLDMSGSSKGLDLSWQEESFSPGGVKSYMKTPQIDGLFVSRGEGRFEKLIKCEECGKVCRTSNMARHKKRYCTALSKGTQTRKNFCRTIDYNSVKDMPPDGSRNSIYMDNAERDDYSMEVVDSAKKLDVDSVKVLKQTGVSELPISDTRSSASHAKLDASQYIGTKGNWGSLMPEQNQDITASARISNMVFSNSPPSTKLMQDKTKMQVKGAHSTHLIGSFHEGVDTGINSSGFEVNSSMNISFIGKNKSERFDTAGEFSTAEIDMLYDKDVKSNMAKESCTGGSQRETKSEETTTDERKFMHRENHDVNNYNLNTSVKKEPSGFDKL